MPKTIAVRLTDAQYAELQGRAGENVSAYIRSRLDLDADPLQEVHDTLAEHERRLSELEALAAAQGAY